MCKTTKKDSLLDLYLPHGDVYKLVDIIINYKITLSK